MARGRGAGQGPPRVRGAGELTEGPLPYGRHRIDARDIQAVEAALAAERITQGPEVEAFEDALVHLTGARHAVAVSSGTAALVSAGAALGLGPGDEGVVPALTFAATAACLLHVGARPVIVDVDAETGNLDPAAFEAAITPATKVVIPAHYAGLPADMAAIRSIASAHGVAVLEDACHALGAVSAGQPVGACALSDTATFSFHPVKAVTTGEGGAVLTNSPSIAEAAARYRHHGIRPKPDEGGWYYEVESLGQNYRITDFQCALGRSQLTTLEERIEARNEIARHYLADLAHLRDDLLMPARAPEAERHAWHLFPVRLRDPSLRRPVFDRMRAAGIGVQVHYVPLHFHPLFQAHGAPARGSLPRAEAYYEQEISMPIFPGLSESERGRAVTVLEQAIDGARSGGS